MSDPFSKIKIAVSSCLLGEKVRYDGGHKKLSILNDEISSIFEFISICPEVLLEAGGLNASPELTSLFGSRLQFDSPLFYDASNLIITRDLPQTSEFAQLRQLLGWLAKKVG